MMHRLVRHRVAASGCASSLHNARGLSIVELLIGVALGLFVAMGAMKLMVDNLVANRQVLLEARVNQELRAAADLVVRDLRRAGYWTNALAGASWPAAGNPYRVIAPADAASAAVTYSYETGPLSGFRRGSVAIGGRPVGVVEARVGNAWQQLTDPQSIDIVEFKITPGIQSLSLGAFCSPACAEGTPGCPTVNVRRYDVLLRGHAVADARVTRELKETVRVRNDEVSSPTCP